MLGWPEIKCTLPLIETQDMNASRNQGVGVPIPVIRQVESLNVGEGRAMFS
jgi:hypothetical protein